MKGGKPPRCDGKKKIFMPSTHLSIIIQRADEITLYERSEPCWVLGNAPHWRSCSFYSVTRPPFPRLFQVALTTVSGKSEYSLLVYITMCGTNFYINSIYLFRSALMSTPRLGINIPEKMERPARMTMYAKTGANKESNVHRSISLGLSNVTSNRDRGDN